jgi:SAM-dependent methyltransferase
MSEQDRRIFERLYARANRAEDLPWHEPEPPALLGQALQARKLPGRALDLGCGAGTYSMWLAERGYSVTAIDFMPQAVRLAGDRARLAGLDMTVAQGDVTADATRLAHPGPFDVILDVGCLHGLPDALRPAYKRQILSWLAPDGDYILLHFGRRGWWDLWPIGPRRISRASLGNYFGPELEECAWDPKTSRGMPLFMGRSAEIGRYWFKRSRSRTAAGDTPDARNAASV